MLNVTHLSWTHSDKSSVFQIHRWFISYDSHWLDYRSLRTKYTRYCKIQI